jgi:hypothetical protein
MAEVGNLTVKVGIDGASKAVQDLEKIRRQLELINTLARNVAASFATVNTQLRTFDAITKGMDNATRSGERYNYTLRNTARIIGDIGRGKPGKGLLDLAQTAAISRGFPRIAPASTQGMVKASNIIQSSQGSYGFANPSITMAKVLAAIKLDNMQNGEGANPFLKKFLDTGAFRSIFGYAGKGPQNLNSMNLPTGAKGYPGIFGANIVGNNRVGLSVGGMLGIAGAAGIFAATIGALVGYMKMLSSAVLQGAQAMSGFVRQAVETAAQFQTIKSSSISAILGSEKGGVYNASTLSYAKDKSNKQFKYMREIAEKSVYTLPEIAGAANILTQNGIPLNKFLQTTAQTAQAVGLKGQNVQEVARIFSRLAYGDFPDREIGAKYGLVATNPALKKLGFRFDKNNSMLNSPEEAVNMTQQFLGKRFDSGFKVSKNDYDIKFASLMDRVAAAMVKVGKPILTALIPAFDQLGKTIDFLSKSGIFDMLGQSVATFISSTMELMKGNEFKRTLAFIFANLNEIPNQLLIMANGLMKVTNILSRTKPMDFVDLLDPIGAQARNLGIKLAGGKLRNNPLLELPGVVGDFASGQLSAVENIMNMTNMFYGMMMRPPVKPQKTVKDLQEERYKSDLPGKAAEEGNKKLQQLVDNSKKLVDLFDLRRQTIGLGPLSQIGVTGVELAAAGMPMSASHKIDPSNYSSISAGPVRGINQLEKGINALNRENQNKAKAGRGIRTSR